MLKYFTGLKELYIDCLKKYKTLDLTSRKKLKKLTITNGSHGLDLLLNENNVIEEFDITSSGWDHSFLSKMNHLTHLSLSGLGVGDISYLTSLKSLYLGYVYTDSEIFKNSSMMPQNLTHLTVENGYWNPEVFSLSFINNCKNLHSLEITIPRTTVDLTSLEIFPNLTELNLALKNLSYIPVDRFPSLVSLIIRTQSKELCNNIAKDFPHLENLLIYNCYLQDLICIKNSQSLRLLELWDSDYISLDEVATCPNLKSLKLNNCDPLLVEFLPLIEKTTIHDGSSKINSMVNFISNRSDISMVSYY